MRQSKISKNNYLINWILNKNDQQRQNQFERLNRLKFTVYF